jgi:hypothetical protein
MQDKYYYLIQALKGYRHITHGQFDQERRYEVKETQDAARAIEELCAENEKLVRENGDLKRANSLLQK